MRNIIEKVARTIDENRLIESGDSVLVALSGGPDSVALLYLLAALRDKYGVKLAAAHLDHGIRKDSFADRQFCRNLCRSLSIKFHSRKADVLGSAEREHITLEEAGRQARYQYLEWLADKHGYRKIATGHTMDDNAETIIFNIARGSGLAGLVGIPLKRGRIIRPLLEVEKKLLKSWLVERGIAFLNDPTNDSVRYSRNRIRKKILPELSRLNPSVLKSFWRLSRNAAEELDFVRNQVLKSFDEALVKKHGNGIVLDAGRLEATEPFLRKKIVAEAFRRVRGACEGPGFESMSRVDRLISGERGGRAPLGDGIWVEKSCDRLSVHKPAGKARSQKLRVPGVTLLSSEGYCLESEVLDRREIRKLKQGSDTALLDYARMKNISIRFWRNGDRIRPLGMRGSRLLSDIFIDCGIPSFQRGAIPLVLSGDKIAWVAGVVLSDEFKIVPETKEVLRLRLCEL